MRASLAVLLLCLVLPLGARAHDQDEGITSEQAAAIAHRAYNGRVVSVEKNGQGGWKVRVLLDGGRVKTVNVDNRGAIRGSD